MPVKREHVRTCFYFELCKGIGCGFKVNKEWYSRLLNGELRKYEELEETVLEEAWL